MRQTLHDILLGGVSRIKELPDPLLPQDAANKAYVDANAGVTFEAVSKNIRSWNSTITFASGEMNTIVFANGTDVITKTFNYASGELASIVLSGNTPAGISLTKTFTYSSGDLTGWAYS